MRKILYYNDTPTFNYKKLTGNIMDPVLSQIYLPSIILQLFSYVVRFVRVHFRIPTPSSRKVTCTVRLSVCEGVRVETNMTTWKQDPFEIITLDLTSWSRRTVLSIFRERAGRSGASPFGPVPTGTGRERLYDTRDGRDNSPTPLD